MTKQEAFDRVWEHFIVDGQPLSRVGGRCYYRSPFGAKCAIGLLIPDELYRDEFDSGGGMSATTLLQRPEFQEFQPLLTGGFCERLQAAHDCSDSRIGMEERMRRIAEEHSLSIPGEVA